MKKTLSLILFLLPLLIGCGNGTGSIEVRETSTASGPSATGMSTAQRLGMGAMPSGMGSSTASTSEYSWDTPEGWTEGETSQFRQVANFEIAADESLECYVSKAGGGVEANVNRWRGQMGLAPLDSAGISALPRLEVLGEDAVYIDVEGTFAGMGQEPQEGMRMLGIILAQSPEALFVKMTGKKEAVEAEKAKFESFCSSLEEKSTASNPHAGMDMTSAMPSASDNPEYHWSVPEGWTEEATNSPMRMATLTVGDAECSVFKFGGDGGGLEQNVAMWLQQMGQDPSGTDAVALEQIEMLGTSATLVRIDGDYASMGGDSGEDFTMLSVYCPVGNSSVFVKFVGPKEQVAAQESAFRAFCASLHSAAH